MWAPALAAVPCTAAKRQKQAPPIQDEARGEYHVCLQDRIIQPWKGVSSVLTTKKKKKKQNHDKCVWSRSVTQLEATVAGGMHISKQHTEAGCGGTRPQSQHSGGRGRTEVSLRPISAIQVRG